MNQSGMGHKVAMHRGIFPVLCSALLLFVVATPAQAQSLLTRHVREDVTIGKAQFLYRMSETQTLRLDIVLPLRDQAGLEKFLQEVYDPTSPSYRHFLTSPEFTARFGPTQEDYDKISANENISIIGYIKDMEEGRKFLSKGGNSFDIVAQGWNALQ